MGARALHVLLGNSQVQLETRYAQAVALVRTLPSLVQWCARHVPTMQIRHLPVRHLPPALATPVTLDRLGARALHVLLGNSQVQLETRYAQTVSPVNTLTSWVQVRARHVPPIQVRPAAARP